MRKLNGSSNYLRNQTWKNLAKATLCLVVFGFVVLQPTVNMFLRFRFGFLEAAFLLFSLVPLVGVYFFLGKYRSYKGGLDGEKRVAKLLSSALNNDYYLLSGVTFKHSRSDVDQIVIGPNGVFVIETKNWSGKISCNGDDWQRKRKRGSVSSPSKQLKRNVSKIKTIVNRSQALKPFQVPVEGVLVFANKNADLHLKKPTVPIVRLNELPRYLMQSKSKQRLAGKLPSLVGEEILKENR
ncbi:MAG: NERD domain-containing protein [Candidatus Bathyarchaeota archaeon]|nr:NERD domain-containing protein [Candidatus Bathyarchaeota archaeon]